ncbi:MAG: DEAD/DEAH box helicase [Clostridium sp.]
MIKQTLLNEFKKSTSVKNDKDGERILKNDLISDFSYENNDETIALISSVISENLFSEYSCKIDIDKKTKEVLFTHCSCDDFEKESVKKKNYCCKHLTATFYKFLRALDEDSNLALELGLNIEKKELVKKSEGSILDFLLQNDKKSLFLKFEVILNKSLWNDKITAQFKIGTENMKSSKLYTLKDIYAFLTAFYNEISLPYGKDFVFNIREQSLKPKDKKLIKFIEMLKEMDMSKSIYKRLDEKLINGKNLVIPKALLREFLIIISKHRVYLGEGFYSRQIETEIIFDKIPIPMGLKTLGDMIKLEALRGVPKALNDNEDVFLYDTLIYLPPEEQLENLKPYLEVFTHGNSIFFTKEEEYRVLKELIPSMQKVTSNIELSKDLSEKIVIAKPEFKFYFDKDKNITVSLRVSYDKYEFDYFEGYFEKVIYRDTLKEESVVKELYKLGFENANNSFVLLKDDDYIFQFFKKDILSLQKIGEVYYSESFTGIKSISKGSFKGDIRKGKYNYFELNFSIKGLENEEILSILKAFRDNKKYYKLKTGEFLDLEEIELKKFLKLLESLEGENKIEENKVSFPKSKGIYLEKYLEEEKMKNFRGRKELKSLKNMLLNLDNINFNIPKNLNGVLRNYQEKGFKWLNTLDYLGFGGILGDEMGLGKTFQTIAFLLSKENSISLIVAPTSLVFNWYSEFKKFAPSLKVVMVNKSPSEREEIIKDYKKYDILITTYNLVKRDLESYKKIFFHYVILDEAQNIKNPSSQNAKSVKELKSKNRFALTGTPIENSLMELWSIFDFIMPNYLYDENKFTTRYYRRLEEEPVIIEELKRLVTPFILRRYKKDVIKELPDKIEKKLIIPMEEEQKKVYKAYLEQIKALIEKKVINDEFKSSKIEILSYITKLRQIAIDPSLVMDKYLGGSGKMEAILELVTQGIEENHKILIFSQFTSVLKNISKLFKLNDISFSYLDGSTPSKERGKLVEDFNKNLNSVFLISLKAGGTGLNLTSADIVIHFDPWWNPAVEDQASDRAHRIGQKNVVEVIKMISENSIEEKIVNLQEEKRKLIDSVMGENIVLGENLSSLTEEDIMFLFSR